MAHHHRHEEERREEEEERYERRQEELSAGYVDEGYGRTRTDTEYVVENGRGGYGRRTDEYEVQPGYARHTVTDAEERLDGIQQAHQRETTYQRTEYLGETGAALSAGFALYERHEEEVDPTNARRHKIEEEIAEGLVVGGAATALYSHHKKEGSEDLLEELETGHKKHGWFG